MLSGFIQKARRAARKPPGYVMRRIAAEIASSSERWRAPIRRRQTSVQSLIGQFGVRSFEELWQHLCAREVLPRGNWDPAAFESLCPGETARIILQADRALRHQVQFLGAPLHDLGANIDWLTDFRVGKTWPHAFFRDIEYANLGQPSDVKIVWELSRMQWLVPLGQAYALGAGERYAAAARGVIESWITANPYAFSVNWSCTMEAAMRVMTWTWLLAIFGRSTSWAAPEFREAFLISLWLHTDFTFRHIERSDINGNHFTADAAALVVAGQLFAQSKQGARWLDVGRVELEREIQLQVFADGVDYEASVPYHRLVLELFFAAAFALRGAVSDAYKRRLASMARFVAAYSRIDGLSPLWGDADDARVLPFGSQQLADHRYLIGLVAMLLNDATLMALHSGSVSEACWWFGVPAGAQLAHTPQHSPASQAFPDGGIYVMRQGEDHIFIDCGPVGLAGRGGHGHNDALSFEAMLDGVLLISDSGAFAYTGDAVARNRFRGTAMHNTPSVDGAEMNSFVSPDNLWQLVDEAKAQTLEWSVEPTRDSWKGTHSGYRKLPNSVTVERRIVLDRESHCLSIKDRLVGQGDHSVIVPLQLAPGIEVEVVSDCLARLQAGAKRFQLQWAADVSGSMLPTRSHISPSYGVVVAVNRLEWRWHGKLPCSLTVVIFPEQ